MNQLRDKWSFLPAVCGSRYDLLGLSNSVPSISHQSNFLEKWREITLSLSQFNKWPPDLWTNTTAWAKQWVTLLTSLTGPQHRALLLRYWSAKNRNCDQKKHLWQQGSYALGIFTRKIKDVTSSCSFSRLEMLTVFCDCDFCVSVCVFFYCCQFCETQNSETDGVFTLQDGDSTSVLCCWKHQLWQQPMTNCIFTAESLFFFFTVTVEAMTIWRFLQLN